MIEQMGGQEVTPETMMRAAAVDRRISNTQTGFLVAGDTPGWYSLDDIGTVAAMRGMSHGQVQMLVAQYLTPYLINLDAQLSEGEGLGEYTRQSLGLVQGKAPVEGPPRPYPMIREEAERKMNQLPANMRRF